MSKVIIDEPGIYRTVKDKMALVFRLSGEYITVVDGALIQYPTTSDGRCGNTEGMIKEKIKGIDLYDVFNKVYGKKGT